MNKLNLFMDFDEVLVDSIRSILLILNPRYGTDFKPDDCTRWDFKDLFPDITSDEVEKCFESDEFWDSLRFKTSGQNVLDFLDKLKSYYNIIVVSKGTETNLRKKKQWLIDNMPIPYNFIPIGLDGSKGDIDMAGGVHIDDNQYYLNESNATYKLLFANTPYITDWNNEWEGEIFNSFYDLRVMDTLKMIVGFQNGNLKEDGYVRIQGCRTIRAGRGETKRSERARVLYYR